MQTVTVYDLASNKPLRTITCPDNMVSLQAQAGEAILSGPVDFNLHHIQSSSVLNSAQIAEITVQAVARPIQAISLDKTTLTADGVDQITISNIQPGSIATLVGKLPGNSVTDTCTSTEVFTTQVADTYTLTISLWPYLDFVTTITAS